MCFMYWGVVVYSLGIYVYYHRGHQKCLFFTCVRNCTPSMGRWWVKMPGPFFVPSPLLGVYRKRDSKNPGTGREGRVAFGRSPKIKGYRISDRPEGEAFWHCFGHRFENTQKAAAFWIGRWLEICFKKDCSIIPPSLATIEFFYHQTSCQHILMKRAQKPQYNRKKKIHISDPYIGLLKLLLQLLVLFAAV